MDRVPSSPDRRRQDVVHKADASTKREENGSPTGLLSVKKNIPSASTTTNSGPSSSTEANERNLSSDDTGAVGGPVHRTLPGSCLLGALYLNSVFEFSISMGSI